MSQIRRVISVVITAAFILGAIYSVWYIWTYYERDPRTRNGHVRADIVGVTTDVNGLVTSVNVVSEQYVKKGDLLFQVDPKRFEIAVQNAQANVEDTYASFVFAQKQASRNHQLKNVVAQQDIDQADSVLGSARANLDKAKAILASSKLDLERSNVLAPVNGVVSYVELRPGNYATAGQGLIALIDTDSLRIEGYFQETNLSQININDRAEVFLMGDRNPVYGRVTSITSAINDSTTSVGSNGLPSIAPNFDWVRLAQRIPVRIKLDPGSKIKNLIPGRSASIAIVERLHNAGR